MSGVRGLIRRLGCAGAVVAIGLVGGCATPPEDSESLAAYREANDPLEPLNRYFFDLNLFLDKLILRPVTSVYLVIPEPPRKGVTNFLRNLDAPVILANDLLQGKLNDAGVTASRFAVNTTFGLLGVFDMASEWGLPRHVEDFGQTLGVWGAGEGPYLVLPVVGPAPPRDAVGRVVDYFLDPLTYVARANDADWIGPTRYAAEAVDYRARNFDQIDEIERTAIDLYATVRSAYRQNRLSEINDGAAGPIVPIPQFSGDGSGDKLSQTD